MHYTERCLTRDDRTFEEASTGFQYCVSTTGGTGARGGNPPHAATSLVRSDVPKNPILVAFRIATPGDAREAEVEAGDVIIGSAPIKRLADGEPLDRIVSMVRSIRRSLDP